MGNWYCELALKSCKEQGHPVGLHLYNGATIPIFHCSFETVNMELNAEQIRNNPNFQNKCSKITHNINNKHKINFDHGIYLSFFRTYTTQKIKFPIKDFFNKRDQICSFLRFRSNLLMKSLMENLTFCAVIFYAAEQIFHIFLCEGFEGKLYNLE